MPKQFRRFEFLLPTRFNNGEVVPSEAFADTLLELEKQFGAVSSESQTIAGRWSHEGQLFRDETVRVFVDVPDLSSNREFFVHFKERLKERFHQTDIWVTSYLLDMI